ncbi:MAG: hypothetical protein AB8G22_09690 [Saprospiraceae bacterium]
MDIQKAKILLEKVNALLKSVSMDADNISNIEKDLMLSYIRQLYDAVLLGDNTSIAKVTIPKKAPKKTRPPVFEIEKEEPAPPPPPRIKVQPTPTYTPPRIIEVSESLTDMAEPAAATPPKVVVKKEVPPPPPPPKAQPKPKTTPQAVTPKGQEGLFEFKAAKELSEKLSERPIRDLTKAFALNDKLLYANELFGKELVVFNESIRQLNGMQNFAEAKDFLSQLATKYKWTKGERSKVAKDFVKLVRRRYV